jgi:uncharacterized protein
MKKLMVMALFLSLTFVGQGLLRAEDLTVVKQRMKERSPAIEELKAKQVLGENNLGFLEFVGAAKEQEESVKAENQDRETVYKEIAQKTKATVDKVGRQRALKIAEIAAPGTMLQDAGGNWAPKK